MVRGGWGLMSEHEGDNRDVDAGFKQMHRSCVPERVWRNLLSSQRRTLFHGCFHCEVETHFHTGATQLLAKAVGEEGRSRFDRQFVDVPLQFCSNRFEQRHWPLFSSFALQLDGGDGTPLD